MNYLKLRQTTRGRQCEIVQLVLKDKRVNPGADNNQLIKRALMDGHVSIVMLLLADPRLDRAAVAKGVFLSASQKGQIDVVMLATRTLPNCF